MTNELTVKTHVAETMGSSMSCGVSRASTTRRPPPLSERDAWAIALAWQDQLRGCVRLETEKDAGSISHTIIPSFEWVTFVFNGTLKNGFQVIKDPLALAAYARAATIAWFALSCCEGYSSTENPVFWKRVFLELLYPTDYDTDLQEDPYPKHAQLPITIASRFFDTEGKSFPRTKLVVGDAEPNGMIERVFFGQQVYPDRKRGRQLKRILKKLKRYMYEDRRSRVIAVMVDELPFAKAAKVLKDATKDWGLQTVEHGGPPHPRMQLQTVALGDATSFPVLDILLADLPDCDVEIKLAGGLWNIVQDHRLCRGLLRPPQPTGKLRTRVASLFIGQTTDLMHSHVGILCSALPNTQTICSVTLPSARYYAYGAPRSPTSDWAWLGYAIFHPDAVSRSGLSSVSLQMKGTTFSDLSDLSAMSSGNNLLPVEPVRTILSSSYVEGRIRPSTRVWLEPRDDSPALNELEFEMWVSLCVLSTDALESQDWIHAVIPGFGLAWIRRCDVIDVRSRQAGGSCIRALRVNEMYGAEDEAKLQTLLTVLGDTLETLTFLHCEAVPVSTVQDIVRLCPRLMTLQIPHDGSFWAKSDAAGTSPGLEELVLQIGGWPAQESMTLQPIQASSLPRLQALRILTYHAESFELDEDTVLSILRSNRGLQYFHWTRGHDLVPSWCDQSYERVHQETCQFLCKFKDEGIDSYDGRLRVDRRLAFLSVIFRRDDDAGVHHFSQDVVTLIFAYATTSMKREIFIQPRPRRTARDHL